MQSGVGRIICAEANTFAREATGGGFVSAKEKLPTPAPGAPPPTAGLPDFAAVQFSGLSGA